MPLHLGVHGLDPFAITLLSLALVMAAQTHLPSVGGALAMSNVVWAGDATRELVLQVQAIVAVITTLIALDVSRTRIACGILILSLIASLKSNAILPTAG